MRLGRRRAAVVRAVIMRLTGSVVGVVTAMMTPLVVSAVVMMTMAPPVVRAVALTVVPPGVMRLTVMVLAMALVVPLPLRAVAVALGRGGGRHQQRRDDQQCHGNDPDERPPQRASARTSGATHGHEPSSAPGPHRPSSQAAFKRPGPDPARPERRTPRRGGAFESGRYWARTSDPQLVELVLSQLS